MYHNGRPDASWANFVFPTPPPPLGSPVTLPVCECDRHSRLRYSDGHGEAESVSRRSQREPIGSAIILAACARPLAMGGARTGG